MNEQKVAGFVVTTQPNEAEDSEKFGIRDKFSVLSVLSQTRNES